MPKAPNRQNFFSVDRSHLKRSLLSGLLVAVLMVGGVPRLVAAVSCSSTSDCQAQIGNLSAQNAQSQQAINNLELQAQGYQGAVNALDAQISTLQAQIGSNQAQQASLQQQIIANEQLIATKKGSLADDIKTMYIDGQLTTIEELATSKDLSDYVDKQQYHTAVQDQLDTVIQQIGALQQTLQSQKTQVDQLLIAENAQNAQLSAAQAQQAQLLSMNQAQQAAYNGQVSANQSKISALQKQQAAIIQAGTQTLGASSGAGGNCDNGHGNGGYPLSWCNASLDALTVAGGFPNRECTSFAYWYFTVVEGHSDFQDTGNANQWLYNSSYPTHSSPQVGAIAVETAGTFGHVAIVQALAGQSFAGQTVPAGEVGVSEMNYDFGGHFRNSDSPMSKFAGYIY